MSGKVVWRDRMAFGPDINGDPQGPYSSLLTWTDITVDVLQRSGPVATGRSGSGMQAESVTLTLDNSEHGGTRPAGRYTPGFNAGPHHPLTDGVPYERSISIDGGVMWTVFWSGFAKGWTASFDNGRATASVTVTQRLALPSLQPLPAAMTGLVMTRAPLAVWPLTDSEDSEIAADAAPSSAASQVTGLAHDLTARLLSNGGVIDFGAGDGPGPDDITVAAFTPVNSTTGAYLRGPVDHVSREDWTLSVFFRPEPFTATEWAGLIGGVNSASSGAAILLKGDGTVRAIGAPLESGLIGTTIDSAAKVTFGQWHHAVLTFATDGEPNPTMRLYVDGVLAGTSALTTAGQPLGVAPTLAMSEVMLGWFAKEITGVSINPFTGQQSHGSVHWAPMQDYQVAQLAALGLGTLRETTTEQLMRLAGMAPGLMVTAVASERMTVPIATAGKQMADAFSDIESVEQGRIVALADGRIRMLTFAELHKNDDPLLVLSSSMFQLTGEFESTDSDVINEQHGSRPDGADIAASDDDSIARRGVRSGSTLNVPVATDDEVLAIVSWIVGSQSEPGITTPGVTMVGKKMLDAGVFFDVLGLAEGDHIRITDLPAGSPYTRIDGTVGRIEVGSSPWPDVTLTLEPWLPVFELEHSEYGRLTDEGGLTVGTALTASGLSLTLAIAAGEAALTTAPADFPLHLDINGETVTAASAAVPVGSSQVVTLSHRGVAPTTAIAHPAGADVAVAGALIGL